MQVEVLSNKTDKYGRAVGKVKIDGKNANLEQGRSGFAWHYKERDQNRVQKPEKCASWQSFTTNLLEQVG